MKDFCICINEYEFAKYGYECNEYLAAKEGCQCYPIDDGGYIDEEDD